MVWYIKVIAQQYGLLLSPDGRATGNWRGFDRHSPGGYGLKIPAVNNL
jgi:hypothetical protein